MTDEQTSPQPIDELMARLGLSNADLVKVSTEQLSFKMLQKARKGRRLSPNIQEKILKALLDFKPGLKLRRRDLFRYEMSEGVVQAIQSALTRVREKQINYPQFVSLLAEAGIHRYSVEVGDNRVTFYGAAGEAHVERGPAISGSTPGPYHEEEIRAAIADTQKGLIDHPAFLKRIHDAGIGAYEVNIRDHEIRYKGREKSYKESIPLPNAPPETAPSVAAPGPGKRTATAKNKNSAKSTKLVKGGTFRRAIKSHRVKQRKYRSRPR